MNDIGLSLYNIDLILFIRSRNEKSADNRMWNGQSYWKLG